MTSIRNDVAIVDASIVRAWLNDETEIAFLDVREAGQFGEGHPFFATPLPYSRLEIDAPRLVPGLDTRIVLLDDGTQAENEGVAVLAGHRLHALGYTNVSVLRDGAGGWQAAGYTLFKGVNLPSKTFGELVEHACETPHLSPEELAALIEEGKMHALFDGRTLDEHRKMTIPGAIPVPNGELAYRIGTLVADPATPIVIHCAGRTRSIIGAQTLRNLGVPNPVIALENGTQGWALAGLTLEHGSERRYPEALDEAAIADARSQAATLAARFRIVTLDAAAAQAWLADPRRTTFLLDVRTPEEFARDGLPNITHAPGGQLVQATDQTIGVRRARVLLVDYDGVRAPVIASWLVQLGFETALVDAADAIALHVARQIAPLKSSLPQLGVTALREAATGHVHLIDLRPSAAYRREHAAGAHWSIRPRLANTLAELGAKPGDTLLLFADEPTVASIAAIDLRTLGFTSLYLAGDGLDTWKKAGLPLVSTPDLPADAARIDYLFFVHDRHDGNLDAARRYLDWETGLIAQCAPDELAVFRIDAPTPDRSSR
ncbi:rhodanese-like domain-containing protein [Caballeronia mineralivorans]|uniref:rhodanese-like domain-containing protein n=1 Tax=Caballeronia mineralivorans TaxID=2010198 RepID=UPI000AB76027|nr:rhodanese-like domain-containing protein [Caballeronia mineralivorans]